MILIKKAATLHNLLKHHKETGKIIGFVPTMGALHQGHLSLIKKAKEETDVVVCSIFVNPTQFNDLKDFTNYPSTLPEDILKLEQDPCDILFLPAIEEIYPVGTNTSKHYELGKIETLWEGHYRPGHFQGVCQVVDKLLQTTQPHKIFLGQKDFQQSIVIRKLIELSGIPVEPVICPTYREESGLAMSSRNMRLSIEQKERAASIFKMMQNVKNNLTTQNPESLAEYGRQFLLDHGFKKVDYVSIVNATNLSPVKHWNGTSPLAVLVAAFMGEIRLIDNLIINAGT